MANKTFISFISSTCLMFLLTAATAQTYDIISTSGTIIDRRSGRELQVGDNINFQTELQFSSLHDRAVLMNSEKAKYFLELPRSSFIDAQFTIASYLALSPVRSRPALITGTRGNPALIANGLSQQTLREYFAIDTFTIIGNRFRLPVSRADAEIFDLLLRYVDGNKVEEYVSSDFYIVKSDLILQGNGIRECFVMLRDGDNVVPVTQLSLFFVDKEQLFREFDSLLNALNHRKENNNTTREILRQYSVDVYGVIDRAVLETTISDYLDLM